MLQSRYTTSYLRRTHENRPKLGENWKLPPTPSLTEFCTKKVKKYLKWQNFTILSEYLPFLAVLKKKPLKIDQKVT